MGKAFGSPVASLLAAFVLACLLTAGCNSGKAPSPADETVSGSPPPGDRAGDGGATRPPDSAGPAAKAGRAGEPAPTASVLSQDEIDLLKAASARYHHNGKVVDWGSLKPRARLVLREAANPVPTASSRIAAYVLLVHLYGFAWAKETHVYKELETGFPDLLRARCFLSVLDEVTLKTPGATEVLKSHVEHWIDDARKSETRKATWMTRFCQAATDGAVLVGETFRPRLGQADLSAAGTLTFTPRYGVDHPAADSGPRLPVRYCAKITYSGDRPLTDVVLVGRLHTTGASSALSPTQQGILAFNTAAGSGDKVPDIRKMLEAQNFLYTMPRATCAYVPTLQPGDVIHLTLAPDDLFGFTHSVVRGGSISLYSAQGQVHEYRLRFSQLLHEGPGMAESVLKLGTTKDEVLGQLGYLTPLDMAQWKWERKPDVSKMQKDVDYFWWSNRNGLPCLVLGFRADRLASLEVLDSERSKTIRLVLDKDGTATVDGTFTKDDPRVKILDKDGVSKMVVVSLTAGSRYTVTLQHHGTKTPPRMAVGGPSTTGYLNLRWSKPNPSTLVAEFPAPVNGTYHMTCECPLKGLCDFTVTVRRK